MSRHDLADALAIFLALGVLVFGFPWLVCFLLHVTGGF